MRRGAWWIVGIVVLAGFSLGAGELRTLPPAPEGGAWVRVSVVALQFACDAEEGAALCTDLALKPPATLEAARKALKEAEVSLLASGSVTADEVVGGELHLVQSLPVPTKWTGREDDMNMTVVLREVGLRGAVRARVHSADAEHAVKIGLSYSFSVTPQCPGLPEEDRTIEFSITGFGVVRGVPSEQGSLCLVGSRRVRVNPYEDDEDPEYRLVGVVILLTPTELGQFAAKVG